MIENIALVIASLIAVYGVNEWRRQLKGGREYELAEEVLTLMYECRDRLRIIRSPFSNTGEGSTRAVYPNETPEQSELLNRAYIVFERYEKNREVFSQLFGLRYRFMAVFGRESEKPLDQLKKSLNEFFVSANMLPTYWLRQGRVPMEKDEFKRHLKEMHEYESVFWGTFSEKDHFDQKIEMIVSEIEATCSRIIGPKSLLQRFHSLMTRRDIG